MLERERPEMVCIAMRHADQHAAVALKCLEAGAHLYMEKPFVCSSLEADQVLALAQRLNRKVAVAHTMRMAPVTLRLREAIKNGLIGDVRELRAFGKQDNRAGGEDMMVLGTHLFDLMRALVGNPESCTARLLQQGRPVQVSDRRRVKDNVGWVAGDQIFAQFSFANGVNATFTSDGALREIQAHWGIEVYGSKGVVRFNGDIAPSVHVRTASPWSTSGRVEEWKAFEPELANQPFEHNQRPVTDWLEAIERNREPECSAANGAAAVEMAMAVYQAALKKTRVEFPLIQRAHPLEG
jgi:predicted dehydrogenase